MYDARDETERMSLGTILTKMRVASRNDVEDALEVQASLSEEERLGELLVARGVITRDELEAALDAQRGLRSVDPVERAAAAASFARASGARVVAFARSVRDLSDEVRRNSSNRGYPAVGKPVAENGG